MDEKALYGEIKREHETLKGDIERLRSAARSRPEHMPDERWRAMALEETRKLRDTLRSHFRLEETDGYLEAVIEKRPGLMRSIRKLEEQHKQILSDLERIEEACRKKASVEEIERLALRGLDLLQKHEAAESDLIQEALGSDLGVCD
jgi:hypothetical protein